MTHQPHPLVPLSSHRLFALDLLKAISITAVISYHAMLVPRSTYADSLPLLEISAGGLRFCVPVLFTISFFLLACSLDKTDLRPWQLLKKRLMRLLIPTTFWFGLAILLKSLTRNPFPHLMERLVSGNIFQGAYFFISFAPVLTAIPFDLGAATTTRCPLWHDHTPMSDVAGNLSLASNRTNLGD